MDVQILQVKHYRGCNVYIRHFIGTAYFEYLAVINNNLYTANIIATKSIFRKNYSKTELESVTKLLLQMSEATIDTILEDNKIKDGGKILSPLQRMK
jgi:hypothetical protein